MITSERVEREHPTILKLTDLDWRPLDPGNPGGPQMAALWGDPTSGPYGALLRLPGGFESPIHSHSLDERVVVIRGTALHWIEGEDRAAAQAMLAGDYIVMPGGVKHASAAAPGEECVEFITQDGAFDFTLAGSG